MAEYPPLAQALVNRMLAAAAAEPARAVSFQGAPGAYSHQAVREAEPDGLPLPCYTFQEAIDAVVNGKAVAAMIPVENNLHGRVADVHVLLPESGLSVTGECYVKVEHCLLGVPGAKLDEVKEARSHPQALGQTRKHLKDLGIEPVVHSDTAAAAAEVAGLGDPRVTAVASRLAGELYGCSILVEGLQDNDYNETRFLRLARSPVEPGEGPVKTTLLFEVKHVPAALFKALGGFATNGVNLTRLESHLQGGGFTAAEFLIDIEGRPGDLPVSRALEELAFHSKWVRSLGSYPDALRERGSESSKKE